MRLAYSALMLAGLAVPMAAQAQSGCIAPCVAEAGARPLRVSVIANLDFARIAGGVGGGTLSIDPVTGDARPQGDVRPIGAMAFSARILVEGEPGRAIRVLLPRGIAMTSRQGGRVEVRRLVTNLPPAPRLGPDGRLEFAIGGDLDLSGGISGEFRGAIEVTAEYE